MLAGCAYYGPRPQGLDRSRRLHDQNNDITNVCEGTGKKNDLDYYYMRGRRTGDFHGQAQLCGPRRAVALEIF